MSLQESRIPSTSSDLEVAMHFTQDSGVRTSHQEREPKDALSFLTEQLEDLRKVLDQVFSPDTALRHSRTPSAGQCAAVAALVRHRFGGDFVSATVNGQSHWFNRLLCNRSSVDVDLTGDQFGRPSVQIGSPNSLYPCTKLRLPQEMNEETTYRAKVLAERLCERLAKTS